MVCTDASGAGAGETWMNLLLEGLKRKVMV